MLAWMCSCLTIDELSLRGLCRFFISYCDDELDLEYKYCFYRTLYLWATPYFCYSPFLAKLFTLALQKWVYAKPLPFPPAKDVRTTSTKQWQIRLLRVLPPTQPSPRISVWTIWASCAWTIKNWAWYLCKSVRCEETLSVLCKSSSNVAI